MKSSAISKETSSRGLMGARTRSSFRSRALRALIGIGLALVPFLVSLGLEPTHRSPYLLTYPAVILSAWLGGAVASVACAGTAAILIEHFFFATHQIDLAPNSKGWMFRECVFLLGSVLAGLLTRLAAAQREQQARLASERETRLLQAEQEVLRERERAEDLRREDQMRIDLALEGAHLGLWDWNVTIDESRWTAGMYRLHGLPQSGPASYKIWLARVHPEDRERVDGLLAEALRTGETFSAEYRVFPAEEQVRWVSCEGSGYSDENGTITRMSGFCVDITHKKRTEAALIQTEKLAVAGRLAASIAHEINNPLEATVNLLYLVRNSIHDPEGLGYLDEAAAQLQRVATISQQTLRFSRTSSRGSKCCFSDLISSTLHLVGPKLLQSRTHVLQELRADPSFFCATGEVQQILTNLLNNAIDAMGQGGTLRIRVSHSRNWANGARAGARITIADNGCGMGPAVLARMREPFFTTKQDLGTGLGMWVVYELLERHQGTLSVRSRTEEPFQGTTFSLFVPEDLRPEELFPPTPDQ